MKRIYSLIMEILGIVFISAGYPSMLIGMIIGQDVSWGATIMIIIGMILYIIGRESNLNKFCETKSKELKGRK